MAAPRPISLTHVAVAAAVSVAVIVLVRTALPRGGLEADVKVSRGEALAAARAFVKAQGDDPSRYVAAAVSGSALPSVEDAGETGAGLVPYRWERNAERWLLAHGGTRTLREWASGILPGPVWQVRFVREEDRHRWWVVVDARDGRIAAFSRGLPEEEAGASLSPVEALGRARAAARERGVDPETLVLVSSRAEERKARRDHLLVFEVPSQRAGEARRRVTVEVSGEKPSLVATALKLPEAWARARSRSTAATYGALAVKVSGFGTVLGLGLVVLLRAHRRGRIRWREAARWAVLLTLPALLERVSALPAALLSWPPETPLATWAVTAAISGTVGILFSYVVALVALGLVTAAAPHALGLLKRPLPGGGTRALRAAAATALLVYAARGLKGSLAAALPSEAGVGGFGLPAGIDGWLPAAAVLASGVETALLAAGGAALAALLFRELVTARLARLLVGLAALGCWGPLEARTFGELWVPLVAGALPVAALAAGVALFLKDDPWAYAFTAAGVVVLREGALLVASGVTPWVASGALCLAAGALVLLAPGWREGPPTPPTPAPRAG